MKFQACYKRTYRIQAFNHYHLWLENVVSQIKMSENDQWEQELYSGLWIVLSRGIQIISGLEPSGDFSFVFSVLLVQAYRCSRPSNVSLVLADKKKKEQVLAASFNLPSGSPASSCCSQQRPSGSWFNVKLSDAKAAVANGAERWHPQRGGATCGRRSSH